MRLDQANKIDELIVKFGLEDPKPTNIPMDPGYVKTVDKGNLLPDNTSADSRLIWQDAAPCSPFRGLICSLLPFLTLYMRAMTLSVCISASLCVSVTKSLKRLLNAA